MVLRFLTQSNVGGTVAYLADLVSLVAQAKPAGGAALDQVVIATAGAGIATAAMLYLITRHRSHGDGALTRLAASAERMSGLPGWAALPSAIAGASLITALVGMYWDISLHIADGRDEGPLANPAHYLILVGLFGVFSSGCLSVTLPRNDEPVGPAPVNFAGLRAPIGGVLMAAAGSFALLGFPLDDVWHRLFGQDVTLWGPTHLMLIGGAGMCLIGQAVLLAEGMHSRRRADAAPSGRAKVLLLGLGKDSTVVYARRVALMGGLLIGLSTFQGEFDFGVPQFVLVFHPILVAFAAGCGLAAARLWVGPGGALGAALFFLLVRGLVSLLVGPVLGEPTPAMPLYLIEALGFELVALVALRRGPVAFGALGGLLAGTVGFFAEYAWTQVAFSNTWTAALLPEGLLLAAAAGLAGGLVGGLLGAGLNRELPSRTVARAAFAAGLAVIGVLIANGLVTVDPQGVRANVQLRETAPGQAAATVRFDPPSAAKHAQWVQTTAWQGGGLRVERLERVREGVYRTTEPIPVSGAWKTLVRLHRGRELAGIPVFLPADPAIPASAIPARASFERPLVDETTILQRELKDDVPGWLWGAASLVVLLISISFVLALGWGTSRLARGASRPDATREPPTTRTLGGVPEERSPSIGRASTARSTRSIA